MLRVIPPYRIDDDLILPYSALILDDGGWCDNCERCGQPLQQNTLLMGVIYLGRDVKTYFHHSCFWTVMGFGSNPISCEIIEGFDRLNSVDQNSILEKLRILKNHRNLRKTGRSIFHNAPEDQLAEKTVVLAFPLVTLERYKFDSENIGVCSICHVRNFEGDLIFYQDVIENTHVECFTKLNVLVIGALASTKGYEKLTEEDRHQFEAIFQPYFEKQEGAGPVNIKHLVPFEKEGKMVRALTTTTVKKCDTVLPGDRCEACLETFEKAQIVLDGSFHLKCFFEKLGLVFGSPEDMEGYEKLSKDAQNQVYKEFLISVGAGSISMTWPSTVVEVDESVIDEKSFAEPTWDTFKKWSITLGAGLVWPFLGDVTEWVPLINIMKRSAGIVDEMELRKEQQLKLDKGRKWLLDKGYSRVYTIMKFLNISHDRSKVMTPENIELVTDLLVFGVPDACPKCNGEIRFIPSRRGYYCQGELPYKVCCYETENPQRIEHPVPLGFSHEELFGKKWKQTKRLFIKEEGIFSDTCAFFNSVKSYSNFFDTDNICEIARQSRLPPTFRYVVNNPTAIYVFKNHYKCRVLVDEGVSYQVMIPDVAVQDCINNFLELAVLQDIEKGVFYVILEISVWGEKPKERHIKMFQTKNDAIAVFEREFENQTAHVWQSDNVAEQIRSGLQENQNNTESNDSPKSETEETVSEIMQHLVDDEFFVIDANGPNKWRLNDNLKDYCLQVLESLLAKQIDGSVSEDDVIQGGTIYHSMFPKEVWSIRSELPTTIEKTKAAIEVVKKNEDVESKSMNFNIFSIIGDAKLKVLNPADVMYGHIKSYISMTQDPTDRIGFDLVEILEIEKPYGTSMLFPNKNNMLLWHGTSKSNVASILKNGLKLQVGRVGCYGDRIYFSNCFSESFRCATNYIFLEKRFAYMFLCEVALENTCMLEQHCKWSEKSPEKHVLNQGCHSVKGLEMYNTFDHESRAIQTDKFTIPLTVTKTQQRFDGSLNYNEYVVHSEDRVRLKYLLRLRLAW